MVIIGKKIKDLRNKSKLTQTELAIQVGVTKSTIAAYENDTRLPSYEVLIKLSQVFHVSIDSLLLNRSECLLDVDGLNQEQISILSILVEHFRKSNYVGEILAIESPEVRRITERYKDKLI